MQQTAVALRAETWLTVAYETNFVVVFVQFFIFCCAPQRRKEQRFGALIYRQHVNMPIDMISTRRSFNIRPFHKWELSSSIFCTTYDCKNIVAFGDESVFHFSQDNINPVEGSKRDIK